MSLSRCSHVAATRLTARLRSPHSLLSHHVSRGLISSSSSSSSSLPSAAPRTLPTSIDDEDVSPITAHPRQLSCTETVSEADYIHIAAGRSGERAEHTAASTASPFSPTFASPTAAAVAASSSACKPCSTSSSAHSASSGFSMDAEYLRRADEEYVLGLFGARLPSEDSVQQKRQQLSVDQQTASQFAGTESRHSAAIDAAALHATPSPPPPQQQQQRKNKAEAKAEARKDRDQGEFDQTGQRVSPVSASHSVKEMEDAGHKQAEQSRKGGQSGDSELDRGADGDTETTKRQQQAPPRPLDDRRPGGETKDGAAPWSE